MKLIIAILYEVSRW